MTSAKHEGDSTHISDNTADNEIGGASSASSYVVCGLLSGGFQSVLFNPWDRALYLSVLHKRPFLVRDNFRHPYSGAMQALATRSLTHGLYFTFETLFVQLIKESRLVKSLSKNGQRLENISAALGGQAAGMLSGIAFHPLSYIKYQCWKQHETVSQVISTLLKSKESVGRALYHGGLCTIYRDVIFCGVFSFLRHNHKLYSIFDNFLSEITREPAHGTAFILVNFVAAGGGVVLSSPLNYARELKLTYSVRSAPSVSTLLRNLVKECWGDKFVPDLHKLQQRLRLGWGSLRVACGMTVGAFVFDNCVGWRLYS